MSLSQRVPAQAWTLPQLASVLAVLVGIAVLAGWVLDQEALKRVIPTMPSMKANTAVGLILLGSSLWLLHRESAPRNWRRVGHLAAFGALLLGALTLLQYLRGWDLGIDQLLFFDSDPSFPGRPAVAAAVTIVLLGSALLMLDLQIGAGRRPAEWVALLGSALPLLALAAYVYDPMAALTVPEFSTMAVHSALMFVLLGAGVLWARPGRGFMAVITGDSAGGVMARRLLPAAVVVPPVLGWLRVQGELAGWYLSTFGAALVAAATIVVFCAIIWLNAHALQRFDNQRRAALERLRRAGETLEARVAERTAELRQANTRLREEVQARAQAEARMRGLLESAPDSIVICKADGRIVLVNAQTEASFGYGKGELLGQSIELLVPEVLRAEHIAGRPHSLAASEARATGAGLQLSGRRRDGSLVPVEINLSPMPTAEGTLLISIIRDVTERQAAERQIRDLNDALGRRAAELEALNRELEAFSYSVSHDLRTPLRAIDGFSQALLEDCKDRLDSRGQSYLQRVRAAAQRMGELIDDLLKLSRVTRADLVREPVDLSRLASTVVEVLESSSPERQVEFRITPGLVVEADRQLTRVALENLLGNAWKFTGKRALAKIELGAYGDTGDQVYFVRDNGAGFDMAYANKLFGAFQRLHGAGEFAGSGIGLATVQRIIQKHGGRIWAQAEVDKGATVYFTFNAGNRQTQGGAQWGENE